MMKILKITLSILLLLLVVVVFAVGSLLYFFDPNQLRPVLIAEVKKSTGYDLTIDGKMTWAYYPRLAIKLDHIAINSPGQAPFVDANDVRLGADVKQLLQSNERLSGHISIDKLKLMTLHAEKVNADLHWQNGVLTLTPLQANLYQGKLTGTAEGKNFATAGEWKWDLQGDNIQVKPLLQDMNNNKNRMTLSGSGQLKMQASTQGNNKAQLVQNLNGDLSFGIKSGAIEGIDMAYLLKSAEALLNKNAPTPPENTNQTAFDTLSGTAVIKNGNLDTQDAALTASLFTAKAKGSVDLISHALNFKLLLKPQEGSHAKWQIPVLISGDTEQPKVALDTIAIQEILAGQEIDKLKEKATNEIKKHVPGKAGELLQSLFR